MKKNILLLLCLAILNVQSIFSQSFQWAKSYGGISIERVNSVVTDFTGCNYIAGDFASSPVIFDTILLSPLGYNDIFIAKTDPLGHVMWVAKAGGDNILNSAESAEQIIKDNNDQIYFVGTFKNTAIFDTISVSGYGNFDGYIAQYNDDGRCIWIRNYGGSSNDRIKTICADDNLNKYIAGTFGSATAYIGAFTLTGGSLNKPKIVIAKYNTDGTCLWAKQSTGGYGEIMKMVTDNSRIFMTGCFNDSLNMEGLSLIENSSWPLFLASFDTNGNIKWLHKEGGAGSIVVGSSLCTDDLGNIYITGYFEDTATFGTQTIIAPSSADMFISKYDTTGDFKWVKQLNASGGASGNDIIPDGHNGIYISGFYKGTALFGTISMTSSASGDMFIAHYDSNSNCIGVRTVANAGSSAIGLDPDGNCVVTGIFGNSITFDSFTLISQGNSDIYLAKLDPITGIEDKTLPNDKLVIYANPTTGKCNITVPEDFLNEQELMLCVYDNTGKLIQRQNLQMEGSKIKLSLEAEAKGIYTATLSNGKKMYAGRIIFE